MNMKKLTTKRIILLSASAAILLFIGLFYLIGSSGSTNENDDIGEYREYLNYTTSGIISKQDPIEVVLQDEVEGWTEETKLPTGLMSIDPPIKGELQVINGRSFHFVPETHFTSGEEYHITLHLDDIYDDIPSALDEYRFTVEVIAMDFTVSTGTLQSDEDDKMTLSGTITFSDRVSVADVETLLQVSQEGASPKIKIDDEPTQNEQYDFTISNIQRQDEASSLHIVWSGEKIGSSSKGEKSISIPGRLEFIVVETQVVSEPKQHIIINFSNALDKKQDFDGLVTLNKKSDISYIVSGNVLKVFPKRETARNALLEVHTGIKSIDGKKLTQPHSEEIAFSPRKPDIRLLSQGYILPDAGLLNFYFEAVNLKAVEISVIKIYDHNILQLMQTSGIADINYYMLRNVGRLVAKDVMPLVQSDEENTGKWRTYAIDLSDYIADDPGAIYRIVLNMKQDYSLYPCEAEDEDTEISYYVSRRRNPTHISEEEMKYWNSPNYYNSPTRFSWRDKDDPCTYSYYRYKNQYGSVAQSFLATNIGLLVKQGEDGAYNIATTNIKTAKPFPNVDITLYNFQQEPIATATTDGNGFGVIKTDDYPYFLTASAQGQMTYMQITDGASLSLSKFDVSGAKIQKGMNGFIYGERGVWRPGDTLFLTFILDNKTENLPASQPVSMRVINPNGKVIYTHTATMGVNGFYRFSVPTSSSDITGNWYASVSVGGVSFGKSLSVETIKPNRLKVDWAFENKVIRGSDNIKGELAVKWLHGAPGKGLKAETEVKFLPDNTYFKSYTGYTFTDPVRGSFSEEMTILTDKTNEEGIIEFDKKVDFNKRAPGALKAIFFTKVHEKGGDVSTDVSSQTLLPYPYFVGLRAPEKKGAYNSSLPTGEDVPFEVITLTDNGKPVARKNLEVRVYRMQWRWWWNSSDENLSFYEGTTYHRPIKTLKVSTGNDGKQTVNINIDEDDGGRFLIRVIDPASGHSAGMRHYFYSARWANNSLGKTPGNSAMLMFSPDKTKYSVGETAIIEIPSSVGANALVSVENSTKVLSQKWVRTTSEKTKIKIDITEEMTPNVFVNISLLQPHSFTKNDLAIRLYGIVPLLVEDPETRLSPQISMPDELKPEQAYTLKVEEKNGRPMTYTIAVVDEGLLGLTRFVTPNPWTHFYQREALGVRTWDIFDAVIGAYGGTVNQFFAIGGGGEYEEAGADDANKMDRFKPVDMYFGPFELEKGETAKHQITMPNYIGAVRTMVVAGNPKKGAYGSVEQRTPVKKAVMALASLPRKLSPGEKLSLPVTIFTMDDKVKSVSVQLKTKGGLQIDGTSRQSLSFSGSDEKMIYFDLTVKDMEGTGEIEVTAKGNGESSTYKVAVAIINPNPVDSRIAEFELNGGKSHTASLTPFGITGSNLASLELSTIPPIDFTRRLSYLIRYPHGCVEQTTSSVFPQLFLGDIVELKSHKKREIEKNVKEGIKRLNSFQMSSGGLSYWQGGGYADDWGTSYAGHFMIEAQRKGYRLPPNFLDKWTNYQESKARQWQRSNSRYNYGDIMQAYRLYSLALVGKPDKASMNRLRELDNLSNEAKWRLAATYAYIQQHRIAKALLADAKMTYNDNKAYYYYSYGSELRNEAMTMETLMLLKDNRYRDLAKSIAQQLSSEQWMSTQTTAYALLVMSKMVEAHGGKGINATYKINGETTKTQTEKGLVQAELTRSDDDSKTTISNKGDNVLFGRIVQQGKPSLGEETAESRNLSLNVRYKSRDGQLVNPQDMKQGTELITEISITNTSSVTIRNVALTNILPSGWEVVNTRYTDFGTTTDNDEVDYIDYRDDRVSFYFTLQAGKTKKFNVLQNTSYIGTYYLPGVQAEAMYNNNFFARSKGKWVVVKR